MTFIYVYFRWGLESQIVDIRYLILILTRELVSDVVERHRVVEAESRGTVKQKMQEQHGGGGGTPPHPGHKLPTVIHRSTQLSMWAMARTIVEWTVQWTLTARWCWYLSLLLTKTTGSSWSSRVKTVNINRYNNV